MQATDEEDVQKLFQKPAKLPEIVTDSLLNLILSGTYPEAARLPSEAELSRQFGVSRTVIREAVARLKSQGFVTSRQGSGVFVRSPLPSPPEDALHIKPTSINSIAKYVHVMEMRRALDVEVAGLAAERIGDDELLELQARLRDIDAEVAKGKDGMEADMAFHRAIVSATRNPYLIEMWNFVTRIHLFKKSVASSLSSRSCGPEYRCQINDEHHALYQAIVARDPEQARHTARHHINIAIERIKLQEL